MELLEFKLNAVSDGELRDSTREYILRIADKSTEELELNLDAFYYFAENKSDGIAYRIAIEYIEKELLERK